MPIALQGRPWSAAVAVLFGSVEEILIDEKTMETGYLPLQPSPE